jgi:Na+-transporting methylmalonyl-CoA/oxaloacetate decarboxylase gamma subunit
VKFVTLLLRLSEAATLVTAAMAVIRWRLLLLLMAEREMASATDRASDRTSERASERGKSNKYRTSVEEEEQERTKGKTCERDAQFWGFCEVW